MEGWESPKITHATVRRHCAGKREPLEDGHFYGIGVFRGYNLMQHSSSGRRSGGVAVFVRKYLQEIDGTIRNSNSGHSTIGAYNWKGEKIISGGIYGL